MPLVTCAQDPAGKMGIRISGDVAQQLWVCELSPSAAGKSRAAVGLYHKGASPPPTPPMPPAGVCPAWTHTASGYYEACGGAAGNVGSFSGLTRGEAQAACCANRLCAGFSYRPLPPAPSNTSAARKQLATGSEALTEGSRKGSGYYKGNARCGFTKAASYDGCEQTPWPLNRQLLLAAAP